MASVYGSSLQAASDDMFDFVCGPCKTEGNIKEARQYCVDCLEYLCDKCVKYHKKLAITKNHNVVTANRVSAGVGRRLVIYCGCHKNKKIEFYCEDHDDVICGPCKSFNHHTCKTLPIQQKSSAYTTADLESILSRSESLKDKYVRLKRECCENKNQLERVKEACMKEIKAFRKELDYFLDKLEENMLAELDQLETNEHQRIEEHIETLNTALQLLEADCQLLNDAKKDGKLYTMFAADVQTSKGLCGYENRLGGLERYSRQLSISFDRNKKLDDLQKEIKAFGSVSSSRDTAPQKEIKVLLGQNIKSRRDVNVRMTGETRYPWISSCVVMPNDTIVICDNNSQRIKLLGDSLTLTHCLDLPGVWGASVFDTNNIVVTIPGQEKLQYVQIVPEMKLGSIIQLDKKCWGVHVAGDLLYVSCHTYGDGEVRVFDKHGNLRRRLGGSLSMPYHINVNRSGNKVFVSDAGLDTIVCLTADGSVIYQYKSKYLRDPYGIYCDDEDNVLVCGRISNNVHIITADGKNGATLLSDADGLKFPHSITFRKSDNSLFVGYEGDSVLVYTLTN